MVVSFNISVWGPTQRPTVGIPRATPPANLKIVHQLWWRKCVSCKKRMKEKYRNTNSTESLRKRTRHSPRSSPTRTKRKTDLFCLFIYKWALKGTERESAGRESEEWVKLKVNSCTLADFIAPRKATTTIWPTDMPYHGGEYPALGVAEEWGVSWSTSQPTFCQGPPVTTHDSDTPGEREGTESVMGGGGVCVKERWRIMLF